MQTHFEKSVSERLVVCFRHPHDQLRTSRLHAQNGRQQQILAVPVEERDALRSCVHHETSNTIDGRKCEREDAASVDQAIAAAQRKREGVGSRSRAILGGSSKLSIRDWIKQPNNTQTHTHEINICVLGDKCNAAFVVVCIYLFSSIHVVRTRIHCNECLTALWFLAHTVREPVREQRMDQRQPIHWQTKAKEKSVGASPPAALQWLTATNALVVESAAAPCLRLFQEVSHARKREARRR